MAEYTEEGEDELRDLEDEGTQAAPSAPVSNRTTISESLNEDAIGNRA